MVVRVISNNWETANFTRRQRVQLTRTVQNTLLEGIAVIDDITPEDTGLTRQSIGVVRQPPRGGVLRFFFGVNVRHVVPYLRFIHNPERPLNFQRPGARSMFSIPGLEYVERVLPGRMRNAVRRTN